jgi:hypothetical protein
MKTCPECSRNYPDEYAFCLDDGASLAEPLAGAKTELIKGPYVPASGGATEQLPVMYVEPAPTEASSLPTMTAARLRMGNAASETQRRRTVPLWVFTVVALLAGGGGVTVISVLLPWGIMERDPVLASNTIETNKASTASPEPQIASPAGDAVPASTTAPENKLAPADATTQSIVTVGRTEAETIEVPVIAQYKRGSISKWTVKEGDVYDPCRWPALAAYTNFMDMQQADGQPLETEINGGQLTWLDSAVILSLDVKSGETYYYGQRLAVVGNIKHIWLVAKVDRTDAARISKGTSAFFTESQSKRAYNGTVDTVNIESGDIRIKLEDEEVFKKSSPKCLNVFPNRTGEVRFAVSTIPDSK